MNHPKTKCPTCMGNPTDYYKKYIDVCPICFGTGVIDTDKPTQESNGGHNHLFKCQSCDAELKQGDYALTAQIELDKPTRDITEPDVYQATDNPMTREEVLEKMRKAGATMDDTNTLQNQTAPDESGDINADKFIDNQIKTDSKLLIQNKVPPDGRYATYKNGKMYGPSTSRNTELDILNLPFPLIGSDLQTLGELLYMLHSEEYGPTLYLVNDIATLIAKAEQTAYKRGKLDGHAAQHAKDFDEMVEAEQAARMEFAKKVQRDVLVLNKIYGNDSGHSAAILIEQALKKETPNE